MIKKLLHGLKSWSRMNNINDIVKYVKEQNPTKIEVTAHKEEWGLEEYMCNYYAKFACYHEESRKPVSFQKQYGNAASNVTDLNITLEADVQKITDETGIAVDKKSEFE